MVINEKLDERRTWAPNGSGGRYIGPAIDHYRCHHVYFNITKEERVGDKVEFSPHHTKTPLISSEYCAALAEANLTEELINTNPEAPLAKMGETQLVALRKT